VRNLTADHAAGAAISGVQHAGLQGMGGVGKTALAVALAHRLKDRWPDAQLYLNLRGADPAQRTPVTPAEAMRDIVLAFHPTAQLPGEVERLAPIYHSVLHDAGRVLLLLDNAADAAQVAPLLPPANCLLLVTSRTQFTLPGIVAERIDSLSPPDACALLLRLAPRLAGHEADAATLCAGLPLALEVFAGAANHRRLTPVPDLLAGLREGKDTLAPVDAAFVVSTAQLSDAERHTWFLLSVFPASFDLPAAAAIWQWEEDAARATMETLVNASLVEHHEATARFRLHDLARSYADRQLDTPTRDATHLRHTVHYKNVAAEAHDLYLRGGEDVARGLALFDRERPHIEAAFIWLESQHDSKSAALLVGLVNAVVYTGQQLRFHPRQCILWLDAQRAAARRHHDRKHEGVALGNLGIAHRRLGDARKAIECFQERIVIAQELNDRQVEGNAFSNLGLAHADLDDPHEAIKCYEQALVIYREIGDRRGEGHALCNLGIGHRELDDAHKAMECDELALVIAREVGDRVGEGNALDGLGNDHANLGDPLKAVECHQQSLTIAREIGDRRGEGATLGNLGITHADLGDPRSAIGFYEKQLVIAREIDDRRGEANALFNSALQFEKLGQRTEALERARAALALYEAMESPHTEKARRFIALLTEPVA
jgi:tetratricopeptide (TPR) repeat protein